MVCNYLSRFFLKIGAMFALSQSLGNMTVSNDLLNMAVSVGAILQLLFF